MRRYLIEVQERDGSWWLDMGNVYLDREDAVIDQPDYINAVTRVVAFDLIRVEE